METLTDMVYRLGTGDKETRRQVLCSMIRRPYETQTRNSTRYSCTERPINIVIPAKKREKIVVMTAHYDIYPKSKGYNDNGSGLAVLLSLQDKIPDNVEIVFTDFEEIGGRGASLYVDQNKSIIEGNINVDVVGLGTKIYYDLYAGASPQMIGFNWGAHFFPNVPFNDSYIFRRENIPSVLFMSGSASPKQIINEVWNAQHGGKNDDRMDLINETGMVNLSHLILEITADKYMHETNDASEDDGEGLRPFQDGIQEMDEDLRLEFI